MNVKEKMTLWLVYLDLRMYFIFDKRKSMVEASILDFSFFLNLKLSPLPSDQGFVSKIKIKNIFCDQKMGKYLDL
jgi:hypothetical protein